MKPQFHSWTASVVSGLIPYVKFIAYARKSLQNIVVS